MATTAQDWTASDHKSPKNQPEPIITYDHMADHESIRYFRISKTHGVSTPHLILELTIIVMLAASLLLLVS